MSDFETIKDRLSLIIAQHKTESEIGDLINRVHQEELESHNWSARQTRTIITTKAVKTAGTISIAQDSAAVTGSGTAFASTDVNSYFRPGSDEVLIRVSAFTSTTAITLSDAWPGSALSGSSYELFPLFYSLPADCLEVRSVSRNGVPLDEITREELHLWDPSRQSSASPALYWAMAGRDSSDNLQLEIWPHETSAVLYVVEYLKGHTDLAADSDRPLVPGAVIENKALSDLCYAEFFRSGDARWQQGGNTYYQRYQVELDAAKQADIARFGRIEQIQDSVGVHPLNHDHIAKHDLVW